MKRLAHFLRLILLMGTLCSGAALAQESQEAKAPAMLVADHISITADNRLVAQGNVEALYGGRRLQARAVEYDRAANRLTITGPLILTDGESQSTTLADSGALDRDMRNGILRGARIVYGQYAQLSAHKLNRIDGRYSQLYKVSVTSCRICETGRPPIWQIRAEQVVHDQQTKQLYFSNAQFRVFDVPVFYLPRLRLPDPTVKRATGFLIPSLYNSSLLGTGAKIPYFIRLGEHRDITLTPFLTTKSTTLELRYRQAFRNGDIRIEGAFSNDDVGPSSNRGYLFARGAFDLPRDFKLNFDIEAVNDDTYLLDYSYSDKDRLDSELSVDRARRDEYMRAAVTHFHSLRPGENNSTLPTIVANGLYQKRIFPHRLGGELFLSAEAHSHYRSSDLAVDGPDPDIYADGRDVSRLSLAAEWRRHWIGPAGVVIDVQTGLAADAFSIRQAGSTSKRSTVDLTPSAGLRLRWPLAKQTQYAQHVIEPVVQFGWVGGSNPDIPNDENTRIEFDEGNLFSFSRFVAPDRRERGFNAAYGLTWTRYANSGWQTRFAFGQAIRDETQIEPNGIDHSFTRSSGLRDRYSDRLIAGQIKSPGGFIFTARGLFDNNFLSSKAEARASWHNDRADFGATYIWLSEDPDEERDSTLSEWSLDGSYRVSRHWTGHANWRYDAVNNRSVRAGLGVSYTNECVEISLSASRRFTSSTILEPSTDLSLSIGLKGFTTTSEDQNYVRTCRK